MPLRKLVFLSTLVTAAAALGPAAAPAKDKTPGPALTTPSPELAASLSCPQGVRGDRHPVLLVPGPGGNPTHIYAAGLEPVLRAHGYPVCGVTLPEAGFADLQIQSEYVVASIREIAARSGRPVSVIGVSQGGLPPRWALNWWPDIRSLVGDVIGLAPSNHGFALGRALCAQPCPPATRQQLPESRFVEALNRGDETPGRVAYSVISSATDVNVLSESSQLEGESDDTNTVIQEICPGRDVDHGDIQYDAVAVTLVLDALRHDGPARASRVPNATCSKGYADGIDPEEVDRQVAAGLANVAANFGRAGLTEVEPALEEYATRRAPRPRATLRVRPRRLHTGKRTTVSVRATGKSGGQRWPLARARLKVAGRRAVTNARGRASLRLRARGAGKLRMRLVAPGLAPVTDRLAVK